ncbi:substrate-binding domain-containing protein [Planctomycetota bacterium]
MRYRFTMLMLGAVMLVGCSTKGEKDEPLLCHVGGTMRPVFEKLAESYAAETGQKIDITSAGSGELLANIELQAEGDLYVSHDPFLDIIMSKGLAINGWTLAEVYPVIIVQKGNPKNIRSLKDLAREDVELALTDYKLSTLGRMLPTIFSKTGMNLDELDQKKNIIIHRSGSYVANLVAMKNADASLVWEAVAALRRDTLDSIAITKQLPVPYVDAVTSATGKSYKLTPVRVTICSLKCTDQLEEAEAFMKYVNSAVAKKILEEYGFGVSDGLRKLEYKDGKKVEEE